MSVTVPQLYDAELGSIMNGEHRYSVAIQWNGNRGSGTSGYRDYGRQHTVSANGKPDILGSSDPTFFGNADRWNPEELLIAAISQCHMLSYLHVAAQHGVIVVSYSDIPTGVMMQTSNGGGHFTTVSLHPRVIIEAPASGTKDEALSLARDLHAVAAEKCFIAASVNFEILHEPDTTIE